MSERLLFISPIEEVNLAAGDDPRVRVQILRTGRWAHPNAPGGTLNVTESLLDEIYENFKTTGQVPMCGGPLGDHRDSKKTEADSWITSLERSPGKLHGIVEFADSPVKKSVLGKRIKFVSAELLLDKPIPWKNGQKGNRLKAVDWTNLPYITNMDPAEVLNLSDVEHDLGVELSEIDFRTKLKKQIDEASKLLADAKHVNRAPLNSRSVDGEYGTGVSAWTVDYIKQLTDKVPAPDDDEFQACLSILEACLRDSFDPIKFDGLGASKVPSAYAGLLKTVQEWRETSLNLAFTEDDATPNNAQPKPNAKPAVKPAKHIDDETVHNEESADPDSDDPSLPVQCQSCAKLADGSCPFDSIKYKLAAAADGHCPQYISKDSEQAPPGWTEKSQVGDNEPEAVKMAEPTIQDLATQLSTLRVEMETKLAAESEKVVALSELAAAHKEAADRAIADAASRGERLQQLEKVHKDSVRNSFIDKFISTGRITPAMGTVALSMLKLADGETVNLSAADGSETDTPATVEVLLAQLFENMTDQVDLKTLAHGDVPTGGSTTVALSSSPADPTSLESKMSDIEVRAKAIAQEKGGSWQSHYGQAAREAIRG